MTAPTPTAPAAAPAEGAPADTGTPDSTGTGADSGTPDTTATPAVARPREPRPERVRSSSREDDAPADSDDNQPAGKASSDWKVEDLPPGAQKMIADLRKEAGTRRTEAGEQKKAADAAQKQAQAVDEKFASAVEAFTKALGLTPDNDEPEKSPEERLGEITSQYKQKTVELAVYKAASHAGGDADALLDSRGFLTRAFAMDPGAEDFDAQIAAAIAEAVEANPKLRAVEAYVAPSAPSGGDFGGGPAERNDPDDWSVDDFRRLRSEQRPR